LLFLRNVFFLLDDSCLVTVSVSEASDHLPVWSLFSSVYQRPQTTCLSGLYLAQCIRGFRPRFCVVFLAQCIRGLRLRFCVVFLAQCIRGLRPLVLSSFSYPSCVLFAVHSVQYKQVAPLIFMHDTY